MRAVVQRVSRASVTVAGEIVGRIEREPPEFHLEFAVDGHHFELEMAQIFEGYRKRRHFVPRKWLDQVRVKADGWTRSSDRGSVYGTWGSGG